MLTVLNNNLKKRSKRDCRGGFLVTGACPCRMIAPNYGRAGTISRMCALQIECDEFPELAGALA